jgi:N-acetylglucosaminyldiphosphoundecaprenol N-acetyl-beta-D-mannosaminyltransferase
MPRQTVEVLGIRFDNLTRREAAEAITRLAAGAGKTYVVKPYSEFMPRAAGDPGLARILNDAALSLPDGVGILWAAHYLSLRGRRIRALFQVPLSLASMLLRPASLRDPLTEAMHGVDFTWEMLGALALDGRSIYLLGGTREESARGAARIAERLPALKIAGVRDGHFRTSGPENEQVVAGINKAGPDVLIVAMGFPRQERWIAANLERLDIRVAVAEGGSLSFISGAARRAPRWMRRAGLEWAFRLAGQPSRLRRQLALPVFVWLVVRERLRRRD